MCVVTFNDVLSCIIIKNITTHTVIFVIIPYAPTLHKFCCIIIFSPRTTSDRFSQSQKFLRLSSLKARFCRVDIGKFANISRINLCLKQLLQRLLYAILNRLSTHPENRDPVEAREEIPRICVLYVAVHTSPSEGRPQQRYHIEVPARPADLLRQERHAETSDDIRGSLNRHHRGYGRAIEVRQLGENERYHRVEVRLGHQRDGHPCCLSKPTVLVALFPL